MKKRASKNKSEQVGKVVPGNNFYLCFGMVAFVFICSAASDILFLSGQILLVLTIALVLLDAFLLFFLNGNIISSRIMHKQMSLGDTNKVELHLTSTYAVPMKISVYDELPYQLQKRNLCFKKKISPFEKIRFEYEIFPTERGIYQFGNTNCWTQTRFGIFSKNLITHHPQEANVYPSIIQMHKYDLMVFKSAAHFGGIKKIRRLGNNKEFEQIKNYVPGDDYRSINWKATSRKNELMVNQYQDERSQQVYFLIDKSRNMRQPFAGLTLLDHAINATLALSNIILKKGDKVGLLPFSDKLGKILSADNKPVHLRKIMESLYHQESKFLDTNYELLFLGIKNQIKGRSLLFLIANFESEYGLTKNLEILQKINKEHLLVVILFENAELVEKSNESAQFTREIYQNAIASKLVLEKKWIVYELRKHGIQTLLTTPDQLSVHTINKYLEIKSRGML